MAAASVVGIIGGTGLGQALLGEVQGERVEIETPFGRPSGPITRTCWEGVEVAFLPRHGEGHMYAPSSVPYRANIYALKALGVDRVIASGATGSLREEIRPRDLVLVDQIIDKTTRRASTFFDEPGLVAHVEFSEPFCPTLRALLSAAAKEVNLSVHEGGTYVCMEGPVFSTVAESRMHRAWGGDLIGMTCMPEAKLAREAEMCYTLIALPTDYDCWRPHNPTQDKRALLEEIIGNVEAATANCVQLLKSALRILGQGPSSEMARCHCKEALDMAIWTDRARISAETVERYGVLLARQVFQK